MGGSGALRPGAYCLFPCRTRPLAVGLDQVACVMEAARVTRLPLCPEPMFGLCAYRGGFVPVVGPEGCREGQAPSALGRRRAVLVLRTGHGDLGLLIDRAGVAIVEDREVTIRDDVEPSAIEGAPLPRGLVLGGAIERGGTMHAILDPGRTWHSLRSEVERWYIACSGGATLAAPSSLEAR